MIDYTREIYIFKVHQRSINKNGYSYYQHALCSLYFSTQSVTVASGLANSSSNASSESPYTFTHALSSTKMKTSAISANYSRFKTSDGTNRTRTNTATTATTAAAATTVSISKRRFRSRLYSNTATTADTEKEDEIVIINNDCHEKDSLNDSTTRRKAMMKIALTSATALATTVNINSNNDDDSNNNNEAHAFDFSFVPKTGSTRANKSLQNVIELTPENFKDYINTTQTTTTKDNSNNAVVAENVFVEFYAPWCPFCQKLEPIWNDLPSELRKYGNETTIARMNVDKYTEYARAYGVSGFPTLMLFESGKPVGAKTGLIDMQTALKYAGVSQTKLGLLSSVGPEKALDKVLSKDEVENARKELGIVRKEIFNGMLEGDSREKALSALNTVDQVFVSQL